MSILKTKWSESKEEEILKNINEILLVFFYQAIINFKFW